MRMQMQMQMQTDRRAGHALLILQSDSAMICRRQFSSFSKIHGSFSVSLQLHDGLQDAGPRVYPVNVNDASCRE
jgi:hypothetical protein